MAILGTNILKIIYRNKNILKGTTLFELKKRYSGSLFGMIWVFLYPLLFLSVYLFLYLLVFKVSYPSLNTLESIIYVFSGLVPYIAFMEVVNSSSTAIKQNMHLIKNVILPVELIPLRLVSMAMLTQCVGLAMIIVLSVINHSFSLHLLLLPLSLIIQVFFLMGLALFIAPIGVLIPDMGYFINILTLLLMFISPIGFMAIMLPSKFNLIVHLNPIYYLIEPFRISFLPNNQVNIQVLMGGLVMAITFYLLGCVLFNKFKDFLADYE